MTGKYDDIINLPHHVSNHHRPMSIEDRAAQFAPFAALTGYGDSIEETGRLTDQKIELDEEQKNALDLKLSQLLQNPGQKVRITYFCPDLLKEGGKYETAGGTFKCVDPLEKVIRLEDGISIPIADIYSIYTDQEAAEEEDCGRH